MHIRDYFNKVHGVLDQISNISIQNVTFDERSEFIGYITGHVTFVGGYRLYISEYVDVEHTIDRIKYSYHLMIEDEVLFRYDNASDPHARQLKTYPAHKHNANGKLIESLAPTLEAVLEEARGLLQL